MKTILLSVTLLLSGSASMVRAEGPSGVLEFLIPAVDHLNDEQCTVEVIRKFNFLHEE